MSDWNPDLYIKYRSERTQPSIDLIAKILLNHPSTIIDIGCGPGNSTQALYDRWPQAGITGLDSSEAMIAKARLDFPHQNWLLADASTFETQSTFDLVFSNAAIQWIPDHERLIPRLVRLLSPTGVLAVQVPQFWSMTLGKIIWEVGNEERWRDQTGDVAELFTMHDYAFYYDQLADSFKKIEIWETDYMHVLAGHDSILELIRSTGLKPYHEKLQKVSDQQEFEASVLQGIQQHYPLQTDGKVILPFKRLFFVGYK